MNGIYLLLGSNLGDRLSNLKTAIYNINQKEIRVLKSTNIYESEPWGKTQQPHFLNLVLEVETDLSPVELLSRILEIENLMGRKRIEKWGERLIDIDILYYFDRVVDLPNLKVPHPEIKNRRFTLEPLNELVGNEIDPLLQKSITELLKETNDQLSCKISSHYSL